MKNIDFLKIVAENMTEWSKTTLPEGFIRFSENHGTGTITFHIGDACFTFDESGECIDNGTMIGLFREWSILKLDQNEPSDMPELDEESFFTSSVNLVSDDESDENWWKTGDEPPEWEPENDDDESTNENDD